jgi:cytochrome subunit of sulfide dehydrogenase
MKHLMPRVLGAGALISASLFASSLAQAQDARYLAANCANCHGTLGVATGGMPGLAGLKKDYIIEQMRAFRDGKRQATIMHQLAKGYTDEQIVAMADFFSRQKAN